ncbi:POLG alternative reading frame-like [Saccopteryx leptura]|uniref:POLG alternative reading frame-like n=1 Tax=Saccopteryx leptura TaxID=249018 RepID=UPI00339C3B5B
MHNFLYLRTPKPQRSHSGVDNIVTTARPRARAGERKSRSRRGGAGLSRGPLAPPVALKLENEAPAEGAARPASQLASAPAAPAPPARAHLQRGHGRHAAALTSGARGHCGALTLCPLAGGRSRRPRRLPGGKERAALPPEQRRRPRSKVPPPRPASRGGSPDPPAACRLDPASLPGAGRRAATCWGAAARPAGCLPGAARARGPGRPNGARRPRPAPAGPAPPRSPRRAGLLATTKQGHVRTREEPAVGWRPRVGLSVSARSRCSAANG